MIGSYRPRLWMVLLGSNLALVLLPIIGIVLSGVIERNSVQDLERSLRLMGVQWATFYKVETLVVEDKDALLRHYPVFEERDSKYNYGVFGIRLPQLDPRILPRVLGWERSDDNPLYPKLTCEGIDGPSHHPAQWIGDKLQQVLNQRPSDDVSIRIVDLDGFVLAQNSEKGVCDRLLIEENPSFLKVLDGIDRASLHRNEKSEPPWWAMLISHWGARDVVVRYPVNMKNMNSGKDHVLALVVLSKTPSSLFEAIRSGSNRAEIRSFFLILAVSLFIATGIVVLSITRPFQAVHAQMKRVKDGERGAVEPVRRTVTREVKDLSCEIASMVRILERREQQTRDLAFHVGHEARTPLTSMRSSIELIRENAETMSAEDKDNFLSIIAQGLKRLVGMTDRLMELAQAERVEVKRSDRAYVEEVLQDLVRDYESSTLNVHMTENVRGASVAMTAELFDSVITSLIQNAHQHGGEDVPVDITVDLVTQRERALSIKVHNEGSKILVANRERIFDPFYTTSRDGVASGLGLTIVKTLIDAHNGTIDLIDAGSGTTFEIILPIR